MADIKAANGTVVTEQMLDSWSSALDRDEWPEGWASKGEVVYGRPPLSVGGSSTLSIKVPTAMKKALEREAKAHGTSTGNYARALLAGAMLAN